MGLFGYLENFFLISLGITFGLILLLAYHFIQRFSAIEKKNETMYDILTNIVKELNLLKKQQESYLMNDDEPPPLYTCPPASCSPTTLAGANTSTTVDKIEYTLADVSDSEDDQSEEEDTDEESSYYSDTSDDDDDEEEDDTQPVELVHFTSEQVTDELETTDDVHIEPSDVSEQLSVSNVDIMTQSDVSEPVIVSTVEFQPIIQDVDLGVIPTEPVEYNLIEVEDPPANMETLDETSSVVQTGD